MVWVLLLISESICCQGTRQEYQNMLQMDPSGKASLSHRHLGQILSEMTRLFFEGIDPGCQPFLNPDGSDMKTQTEKSTGFSFDGKQWIDKINCLPSDRESSYFEKSVALNVYHRNDYRTSVRWFVCSLSLTYNNLLMGILGNITLIGMDCRDNDELTAKINRIERLITSAANLTHLLFGYLSERRVPAKKLQLTQLLAAVNRSLQNNGSREAFGDIQQCMRAISPVYDRATVASGMAGVLEQLLVWIKMQRSDLDSVRVAYPQTERRLALIEALIGGGMKMVQQLRLYSGVDKPAIKRASLRTLLHRRIEQERKKSIGVRIKSTIPKSLPWVQADRQKVGIALDSIIENAVDAMPGGGELHVSARMLYDERPHERCAVHSGGDYVVISIADTGCGMDVDTQGRIFEPFFGGEHRQPEHFGMGLCAACGIVKAHGGYIQVRSAVGKGSIFKIYLPVRQKPGILLAKDTGTEVQCAA